MVFDIINQRTIVVTVTVNESGFMSVEVRGPLSGSRALVQLLDSARNMVVQGDNKTIPERNRGLCHGRQGDRLRS